MPSTLVYTVDFANGNLAPSLDTNGWGTMKIGLADPAASPATSADPQGLTLSLTPVGAQAVLGAFVVLAPNALSLQVVRVNCGRCRHFYNVE